MIGERIVVLEKFFKVRKPKNLDPVEWLDKPRSHPWRGLRTENHNSGIKIYH